MASGANETLRPYAETRAPANRGGHAPGHVSTRSMSVSAPLALSDCLVVILDLDAYAWQHVSPTTGDSTERADAAFETLQHVISAVLVFLNAYTAMQHGNGLVVYGAAAGTAHLLSLLHI